MIRSFSLRIRCATASSRASADPGAALVCDDRVRVRDDLDVRLCVAVSPERVPRDADALRDEDPPPAARRDPLREDEVVDDLEPALPDVPLLEPLLLA